MGVQGWDSPVPRSAAGRLGQGRWGVGAGGGGTYHHQRSPPAVACGGRWNTAVGLMETSQGLMENYPDEDWEDLQTCSSFLRALFRVAAS
jgi:hypothetical protein